MSEHNAPDVAGAFTPTLTDPDADFIEWFLQRGAIQTRLPREEWVRQTTTLCVRYLHALRRLCRTRFKTEERDPIGQLGIDLFWIATEVEFNVWNDACFEYGPKRVQRTTRRKISKRIIPNLVRRMQKAVDDLADLQASWAVPSDRRILDALVAISLWVERAQVEVWKGYRFRGPPLDACADLRECALELITSRDDAQTTELTTPTRPAAVDDAVATVTPSVEVESTAGDPATAPRPAAAARQPETATQEPPVSPPGDEPPGGPVRKDRKEWLARALIMFQWDSKRTIKSIAEELGMNAAYIGRNPMIKNLRNLNSQPRRNAVGSKRSGRSGRQLPPRSIDDDSEHPPQDDG